MEDCFGRVPEWLIGAVLKTVVRDERTVGSNPTSSFFIISIWCENSHPTILKMEYEGVLMKQ